MLTYLSSLLSFTDCQKVLTLYGLSNLVNAEDNSLDEMDPYHYNSRGFIWKKVMKGDFKLPSIKNFNNEGSDSGKCL